MVATLRSRQAPAEPQESNVKASKPEKTTKAKRKAVDDISPLSPKQQKSAKKVAVAPKKEAKRSAKPTKIDAPAETEPVAEAPGQEEENEDGVLTLATELDSDEGDEIEGDPEALFKSGQDVGKIPKISKKNSSSGKPSGEPGVVYIGRIPHGFYEFEMKQYFAQFGPVSKLRLSRNKRTGASKHFAFVEFAEAETAEIVAKTMDNYLLFGHLLKCKVVPKEQLHEDLFKGANRRFKRVPWNKMAGKQLEKPQTESAWKTKVVRERNKRVKQAAMLKEIGYEFEAPELKEVPAPLAIENGEGEVKAIEEAPAAGDEKAAITDAGSEPQTENAAQSKGKRSKASKSGKAKKAEA